MLFFLNYYLWIAPHILLGICLWMFLRRGLRKQFPFFVAYMLSESVYFLVTFLAAFLVRSDLAHGLHTYRLIAVWGLGIISLISFGVIYELVKQLILSRSDLAKMLQPVIRWSTAALLLLTVVASAHLGATVERVMDVFEVLDFSASALQVGLLLVLFLFSRALRVSWRNMPEGIALGLGILGCVELATAPLFSVFSQHRYSLIDDVRMAGFHVCVLVWLGYLVFPERRPKLAGQPLQTSDLESWDQEMQRMVQNMRREE
jgi:hypothetical protein